ncbi:MAG: hypothetical protein JRF31_08340 [Deltaproteobacteria bacterium]|nr:hypothetical protein [Deltaproteobacteria bacterium]
MKLINMEDRDGPFCVFNDFEQSFDRDLHKANIEFLNQHPELIKKIQSDLNDLPVRWRIESISHRLLYVPE